MAASSLVTVGGATTFPPSPPPETGVADFLLGSRRRIVTLPRLRQARVAECRADGYRRRMSPRRAVWVCIPLLCLACGKRSSDPGAGPTQVTAVAASGPGAIRLPVKVDEKGFTPSSVAIKQGIPASVVFTRTSDDTCATQVVFPEL